MTKMTPLETLKAYWGFQEELERLTKKVKLLEEFIELEDLKESLDVWIRMRRENNDQDDTTV